MVMLSKFRHFRLRDDLGQQYRLGDLAVALLESDILLLINDQRLTRELKNTRLYTCLGGTRAP